MTTATTPVHRIVNFSPGPACLPLAVLETARENLLSLGDSGLGVMEVSHRGPHFKAIVEETEANLRELLGLDDEWAVLFLQGGASQQFFQVPMNFLGSDGVANYIDTGAWSAKAIKQAERFGGVHIAASSKDDNYTYIPAPDQRDYKDGAVYTHFTSNNTIFGTQFWPAQPADAPGPLVCDASSDILCRRLDLANYGVIYAGAQKNLGPSGLTLVMIKKELAERGTADIPELLQYRAQIKAGSMANTPATFPIYVLGLTLKWLKGKGGLEWVENRNEAKANWLYDFLDESDFWETPVARGSRSWMNVVFRLKNRDLEPKLIETAEAEGFSGIKGHRSVGGLRVSIYNAIEPKDVESFCEFLAEFQRTNG